MYKCQTSVSVEIMSEFLRYVATYNTSLSGAIALLRFCYTTKITLKQETKLFSKLISGAILNTMETHITNNVSEIFA